MLQEPDGFEAQFSKTNEKIRIKQADLDKVEEAARTLAKNAVSELDNRCENVHVLEQWAIFDPQLFPRHGPCLGVREC